MAIIGKYMILQTVKHIFPPWILVLPIALFAADRLRHKRGASESYSFQNLALLLLFAFFTIAALSPTAPSTFFRYLAPLIPIACIIMGLIIESSMKVHPAVGLVVIVLLAWWWRMPSYLYEITHDYDGPVEGIVLYLNEHAGRNDVVAATNEDLPIKWYTGLRVISGVSGEDYSEATHADWLVMRRFSSDPRSRLPDYLDEKVVWDDYEEILLPYPDYAFENREAPELHQFRTPEEFPPVVIYRRITD